MVRLKEIIEQIKSELKNISIPYGAIKRFNVINKKECEILFQFLMVRLKENNTLKITKVNRDFNSLWCD
ncbi:MAG: hypothetical protein PWQ14_1054 [Rikenellaceae bacterium]|nr:hypothetical protein [Rikenellaceae bacterium]